MRRAKESAVYGLSSTTRTRLPMRCSQRTRIIRLADSREPRIARWVYSTLARKGAGGGGAGETRRGRSVADRNSHKKREKAQKGRGQATDETRIYTARHSRNRRD